MQISLKQCLKLLESGDWVNIRYITADIIRKTGGKVIELSQCKILKKKQVNVEVAAVYSYSSNVPRNPMHNEHFTRNVELPNGMIRKVHPILITHINGNEVV